MALSIPIVSEFDGKGIDKAIKEFKQLETVFKPFYKNKRTFSFVFLKEAGPKSRQGYFGSTTKS